MSKKKDEKLNEKAKKLINKEEYKKALEVLDKIQDKDVLYKKYINKGVCYKELKMYDAAMEYYNKAIELEPFNHMAYTNMGNIYSAKKKYDLTFEFYNKALNLKPDDNTILINLAISYYNIDNYDKAIEILKKINIKKFKKEEKKSYYIYLAHSYFYKKDYNTALKYFLKYPLKYSDKIAECYEELNKPYRAKFWYYIKIKITKEKWIKLNEKAKKYINKGRYKKAISIYEQMEEENAQCTKHNKIAECYTHLKMYDKAIEYYNKAIKINPSFCGNYINLSNVYSKLNREDLRIELLNKALSLKPNNIVVLGNLAFSYYNIENYDKSLEISKSINIKNLNKKQKETIYENIAFCYFYKKDYKNALKYFLKYPLKYSDKIAECYEKLNK